MTSLKEFDSYGGYSPFHEMNDNGYLGSHVDHSHKNEKIHIANAIYYCSNNWKNEWGGETLLFNKSGLKIRKKIIYKKYLIKLAFLKKEFGITNVSISTKDNNFNDVNQLHGGIISYSHQIKSENIISKFNTNI